MEADLGNPQCFPDFVQKLIDDALGTHSHCSACGLKVFLADGGDFLVVGVHKHHQSRVGKLQVRTLYPTREALQSAWDNPGTRSEILRELTERGISFDELATSSEQPDAAPFDLLRHLAWNVPLLTRRQRAWRARRHAQDLFAQYGDTAREILTLLFERYVERGILQFNALSELMKVQPFCRLPVNSVHA